MATRETALGLEVTTTTSPTVTVESSSDGHHWYQLDYGSLIEKAIDANVSIDTMERLLALRDRLQAEQARQQFFAALSAFQGACPIIPKTKTATVQTKSGGSYKYSYAPLDVIVRHVGPLLEQHGLSVSFNNAIVDGSLLVSTCTVHHIAGHHEASDFRVPIDAEARMNDAQKVASASTYAKRYAYCNALGILTGDEDDDAGALGGGVKKEPFTPPKRKGETSDGRGSGLAGVAPREGSIPPHAPSDLPPLTDAELAALDRQDAQEQESAAGPSDPPTAPAQPVVGPCITAAQVKRAHSILRLACKGDEAAMSRARAMLWVKLTHECQTPIEKFEQVPQSHYNVLCDEWLDKASEIALRSVAKS